MEKCYKVKAAVVGCGMISGIYIKNLSHLFSVIDICALCDAIPQKAEEMRDLFRVGKVMTYEDALGSSDIELIINLTGPAIHYEMIKAALLSGKHVYTEKMLCINLEQGKELVQLANEKKLYLGVAPDTFLGAGLQTARQIIDSGLVGKVTSCFAAINRNHRLNSERFHYIRHAGGSFSYDIGPYYVTAIISVLGPIKKITGFSSSMNGTYTAVGVKNGFFGQTWPLEGNNVSVAAFQMESGVLGTFHFNGESIAEEYPNITIYGTKGILYLGDPNTFNGYVKLMRHGSAELTEIPFTHGYCGKPTFGPSCQSDYGQHRGVGAAEMAWSILQNRPHRASGEMGLHAMEVLCGMEQSASQGNIYNMTTTFQIPAILPSGFMLSDEEDGETALLL